MVEHVEPVPEHGTLDLDDVVGVERVLAGVGEQEAEHRGQADAADRGRRRRGRAPSRRRARPAPAGRPARTPRGRPRVSRPPRPRHVAADQLGELAAVQRAGAVGGDQLERGDEVGHHDPVGGELALGVVEDGPALRRPSRRRRRGCSRGSSATPRSAGSRRGRPRSPARRARATAAGRRAGGPRRTPPASRAPRPSPGPMVMSTPPPYAVGRPRSTAGRSGRAAAAGHVHPAVHGVRRPPSAGCTVTNPPELSETIPTSLTIATSAAASAASTALPPARATCSAASAAASFGAATARADMPARYPPGSRWTTVSGPTVLREEGQERRVRKLVG